MIYSLVFLTQLLALGLYMAVFTRTAPPVYFLYGTGIYFFSILLFIIGIYRSRNATPLNCFTVLLFLANLILIVLFLFTGYLGSFISAHQ